jgi:endonuclease YncB( thermonuclease family)
MAEKYKLLYGQFVIRYPDLPNQGPEPDGDTVKFAPDNQNLVCDIPQRSGRPPKINARGISVRLEAIDALETHFENTHQELTGGKQARDTLLAKLGFTNIVFSKTNPNKIKSADQNSLPGFVLSNGIDANGRLIGFVYQRDTRGLGRDGATVTVDNALIDRSINATLLEDGHVFPAFYGTLPAKLREHLATKSQAARKAKKGIWPRAKGDTTHVAEVSDLASLTTLVIWPKLFRRLVVFLKETERSGLDGFENWLKQGGVKRNDKVFRLDTNKNVRFSDILTIRGDTIALNVEPEKIVIEPDPASREERL